MDKEYIETLIKKDIKTLGYDIWGIELLGSSLNPTLRIFIDNENGVTVEDCEKVSKHVSKVIEADDTYSINSILEVSSPGIERKFFNKDQYINYLGYTIKIRYRDTEQQFKSVKGVLSSISKKGLSIKIKEEECFIQFQEIEKANLEFTEVKNAK
jgi:ribosome maturation factor RimP